MEHEDSLSTIFGNEIRPFIDVIDNLRKIGIQQDIPLPNVVVVGDQSSGKSSIIEALSGVQLPRGKGIVTRCPLELQLKRVLDSDWVAKLSYQSMDGENIEIKIDSPENVEEFIRQAQDKICGTGKGVSEKLITLRIESPAINAPDLTLIDLPGIARIALADQDRNICEQIRKTILGYVRPSNTVILCVISAFLDIAVNESINIATTVDEFGTRTIGVITKPDLADEPQKHEVLCILNNERINLKKGFSMVKCRSQKELDENVLLETSIGNEREFFDNDEIYRNANKSQLGTLNLATKISEELVDVIKSNLPQLKSNIDKALIETQEKLDRLPGCVPEKPYEKRTYISKAIYDLNNEIKKFIHDGTTRINDSNMYLQWTEMSSIFCKSVRHKNEEAVKHRLSIMSLTDEISKCRGREISFFFNFELFEKLVTKLISTYEADAKKLANSINSLMENSISKIINESFKHIPSVDRELKGLLKEESMVCLTKTLDRIEFVFQQEKYAFTMDYNFENALEELLKKELENEKEQVRCKAMTEKFISEFNKGGAKSMHNMILIYLKIVATRLCDVIPMTVHHCSLTLLNSSVAQRFLEFATSPGVENKITENRKVYEERRRHLEKIDRLHKAQLELIKF